MVYHKDNILFIKYKIIEKKILKNYDYFYYIFNNYHNIILLYIIYIKICIKIHRILLLIILLLLYYILLLLYYK